MGDRSSPGERGQKMEGEDEHEKIPVAFSTNFRGKVKMRNTGEKEREWGIEWEK